MKKTQRQALFCQVCHRSVPIVPTGVEMAEEQECLQTEITI